MNIAHPDSRKLPKEVLESLGLAMDSPVRAGGGSVSKIMTPQGPVWLKVVEAENTLPIAAVVEAAADASHIGTEVDEER